MLSLDASIFSVPKDLSESSFDPASAACSVAVLVSTPAIDFSADDPQPAVCRIMIEIRREAGHSPGFSFRKQAGRTFPS